MAEKKYVFVLREIDPVYDDDILGVFESVDAAKAFTLAENWNKITDVQIGHAVREVQGKEIKYRYRIN